MSASILDRIVQTKRDEVKAAAHRLAEFRDMTRQADAPRGFAAALRRPSEVRLLAEVKRRSPSAGDIRPGADPVEGARAYVEGGAAALSVLTDRDYFGGDLAFLRAVRSAVDVPVIRKDFLIDPLQVWEARAAGADAVLLIVRILDPSLLRDLHGLARDLDTFVTDLDLSLRLAPRVPAQATYVAESGIRTAEDVDRLGAAGVDAILVGESLMRQADLRAAAAALAGRPRRAEARAG